jgi:hypothetical protein
VGKENILIPQNYLNLSYLGRNTLKVAPIPGLPSAIIKPLWFSAIFLQMESPMPVPT